MKHRLRITQNEVKTSPALVTVQIPISEPFFLQFEPHFGCQNPSRTKFGEPLKGDNVSDMIIDSTKLIMLPFCDFTNPTMAPVIRLWI